MRLCSLSVVEAYKKRFDNLMTTKPHAKQIVLFFFYRLLFFLCLNNYLVIVSVLILLELCWCVGPVYYIFTARVDIVIVHAGPGRRALTK